MTRITNATVVLTSISGLLWRTKDENDNRPCGAEECKVPGVNLQEVKHMVEVSDGRVYGRSPKPCGFSATMNGLTTSGTVRRRFWLK